MAAGQMKAGQETLKQAAQKVVDAKADFDRQAANLHDQIQATAAKWQGKGGNAFQTLGHEWHDRQTTILKALNHFEQSLNQTQQANHAADDHGHQNVNQFVGKLGDVQAPR